MYWGILAVTILVAFSLFFLARLLVYLISPDKKISTKIIITKTGYIVGLTLIVTLATGYSFHYFYPQSTLGKLVSTNLGKFVFTVLTLVIFVPIESYLLKHNFPLIIEKDSEQS